MNKTKNIQKLAKPLRLTTYHLRLTTYHLPLTTYHLPLKRRAQTIIEFAFVVFFIALFILAALYFSRVLKFATSKNLRIRTDIMKEYTTCESRFYDYYLLQSMEGIDNPPSENLGFRTNTHIENQEPLRWFTTDGSGSRDIAYIYAGKSLEEGGYAPNIFADPEAKFFVGYGSFLLMLNEDELPDASLPMNDYESFQEEYAGGTSDSWTTASRIEKLKDNLDYEQRRQSDYNRVLADPNRNVWINNQK
ncbi:MAG: hypothetical protein ABIA04_11935 [Pseudomonadota bacterium]